MDRHDQQATRSIVIHTQVACTECVSAGKVLLGLRRVLVANPRWWLGGLWAVVTAGFGLLVALLWIGLFEKWTSASLVRLLGVPVGICAAIVLQRCITVRVLMCPVCRRVLAWGFGREIPLSWKERIPFERSCMRCGYCLVGCTKARCPECCEAFPTEWLKATRNGDEGVEIRNELAYVEF